MVQLPQSDVSPGVQVPIDMLGQIVRQNRGESVTLLLGNWGYIELFPPT